MVIPTVFIVGAPRCGTTSLAAYLDAHPRIFMSKPKEPHHFCPDLDLRLRPYADRGKYLELFHGAGDAQLAGEASILYLYSKTAPHAIRELSPSARIIIMLRDPVEMVRSMHAHNLLLGNEDLPDLGEALAAEAERRQGRRLSWMCFGPAALQYSALGKYTENVRRYQEVFGRDRVKCILFDDLRKEPEKTYRETLAFLGLEPGALPEFKVLNERKEWRSPWLGRAMVATFSLVYTACSHLPTRILRKVVLTTLGILFVLAIQLNLTKARRSPLSAEVQEKLRQLFRDDVDQLASLIGRDLSSWLQPEPAGLGAGSRTVPPRLKHRWRIGQNYLGGITFGQWRRLLRENRFAVDAAYWHRAAFITLRSVLNSLASRKDEQRYRREIDKTVIAAPPLFILGDWRTGATFLQDLLSRDQRFAYPSLHEVLHPGSFLSKRDKAPGRDIPREDELAVAVSCLRSPAIALNFPRTGERYLRYLTFDGVPAGEVEEWKRTLLWFLKKLTFRYRGRPLVLASPPHAARIRLLLELLPEARFVNIHRNPYAVFQSWRHAHDTGGWFLYLQKPDLQKIDDRILEVGQVVFEAYFEQRQLIPPGRLVDVAHEDLAARPVEVTQGIYEKLGLPAFEEFRPRLQAYVDSLAAHPANLFPELAPKLRGSVARAWPRAFEEWGYPI